MKTSLIFAVLLPLALGACGIPDMVAYGVKSAEKAHDEKLAKERGQAQPTATPAATTQPTTTSAPEPPPPTPAVQAAPIREPVSSEPLK